jgi:hypothetical protein
MPNNFKGLDRRPHGELTKKAKISPCILAGLTANLGIRTVHKIHLALVISSQGYLILKDFHILII